MSDDQNTMPPVVQARPEALEHDSIMDQSLSDILKNNPEAKQKVMQAMGVSEEQLKTMLQQADSNELMHKNVGELFKSGFIQQAVNQTGQVAPEQMQQVANTTSDPNTQEATIVPDQAATNEGPVDASSEVSSQDNKESQNPQNVGDLQIPQKFSDVPGFAKKLLGFFKTK